MSAVIDDRFERHRAAAKESEKTNDMIEEKVKQYRIDLYEKNIGPDAEFWHPRQILLVKMAFHVISCFFAFLFVAVAWSCVASLSMGMIRETSLAPRDNDDISTESAFFQDKMFVIRHDQCFLIRVGSQEDLSFLSSRILENRKMINSLLGRVSIPEIMEFIVGTEYGRNAVMQVGRNLLLSSGNETDTPFNHSNQTFFRFNGNNSDMLLNHFNHSFFDFNGNGSFQENYAFLTVCKVEENPFDAFYDKYVVPAAMNAMGFIVGYTAHIGYQKWSCGNF